jgi:hypothetical protein
MAAEHDKLQQQHSRQEQQTELLLYCRMPASELYHGPAAIFEKRSRTATEKNS